MKKAASAGFEPASERTDTRSFQAIISNNRFERFASVAMAVRLHVLVSQTHVHSHELLSWRSEGLRVELLSRRDLCIEGSWMEVKSSASRFRTYWIVSSDCYLAS